MVICLCLLLLYGVWSVCLWVCLPACLCLFSCSCKSESMGPILMCISRKIYADLDTFLRVTWVSSFDLDLHRGQGWKYTSLQISQKEGKKWNYKLHQLIHQIYSRFIGTNLIRLLWKVKVTRSLKNSIEKYFFKKIFERKAWDVIFTSKDNLYRGDRKICSSGDLD